MKLRFLGPLRKFRPQVETRLNFGSQEIRLKIQIHFQQILFEARRSLTQKLLLLRLQLRLIRRLIWV